MAKPPADYESFVRRFHFSQSDLRCDLQRGFGMPCPFCAAPAFTRYPVFETPDNAHPVQTCRECERSGKFTFERFLLQGLPASKYYVLQTDGPPQPDWLAPRIGWVQ